MSVVPSAEGSRIVSMPKIDDRVVEGMRLHEFLALEEDKELALKHTTKVVVSVILLNFAKR